MIGTAIVFLGAYLLEKTRGFAWGRGIAQFMAMLPMAVPGLVIGLAYIFFFNAKGNPLGFDYATMIILVVKLITHFYTVSHLTATAALKQLDSEFEAVSASLKVSLLRTMARVTLPICVPAVLDITIYLFVERDDHLVGNDIRIGNHQPRRGRRHHQHGRVGLHRGRRRDGHDHRGHVGRRQDHPRAADATARSRHPGLAAALSAVGADGVVDGNLEGRSLPRDVLVDRRLEEGIRTRARN